jgi:ubiquitin C-terminal hydrolase
LTEEVPKEMNQEQEKRPRLVRGLNNVENVVYYGASLFLLATIGVLIREVREL